MITPFYTSLLALGFIYLSVRTLRLRHRLQIGVGDNGNKEMLRAIRVHGNFSEYVPISLLLIYMLENLGAYNWLLHFLCITLIIGRILHALGVRKVDEDYRFRIFGMVCTFTVIGTTALAVLFLLSQ